MFKGSTNRLFFRIWVYCLSILCHIQIPKKDKLLQVHVVQTKLGRDFNLHTSHTILYSLLIIERGVSDLTLPPRMSIENKKIVDIILLTR